MREAIRLYNRTRELLKQLYDLRKEDNPPITGAQTHSVLLAATTTERENYNQLLSQLLNELKERRGSQDYRARLLIVGSVYDDPNFTKVIEEAGGLVVADALCFGSRYFWEPVPEGDDLLSNIAISYLKRPACARMAGTGPERLEFIKGLVRDFKVDGVIFEVMRNCDLWSHVATKRPQDLWIYEGRTKYYEQVYRAREMGKPLAWQGIGAIPELLHAMDIVPISPESFFAVLASFPEGVAKYLDIAERFVPPHICAANKAPLGAIVSGDLPKPDVIIHASQPCDSGLISYPTLADYLGVPHFCLDIPYWEDERTIEYVAEELKRLVAFLEETTGKRLEEGKLRQVIEYSNQAHYYLLKANELRKNVPCPLPSRLLLLNSGAFISMAGTPELVDYARTQYELAKTRVEKGQGHLPEEKKRIAFIYTAVFCDPGLYDWVEQEHKTVIAIDMMGNYVNQPIEDLSSLDAMFWGLARKLLSIPMARESRGPRHYWYRAAIEMCREYKVDGAVFAGNTACKHGWAIVKLVKDVLYDEVKIPTLIFDVDLMDPRITSPQSVRSKIGDFLSLL